MNKIQGLETIKDLGLPTIPWLVFNPSSFPLDLIESRKLWTVRTSKKTNVNNPRAVGVPEREALGRILQWHHEGYGVIYYPFFKALLSGVAWVRKKDIVVEAVVGDLWRLVTDGEIDFRVLLDEYSLPTFRGFMSPYLTVKLPELGSCLRLIKPKLKGFLEDNNTVLLEWSVVRDVSEVGQAVGNSYLVFYEMRLDGGVSDG